MEQYVAVHFDICLLLIPECFQFSIHTVMLLLLRTLAKSSKEEDRAKSSKEEDTACLGHAARSVNCFVEVVISEVCSFFRTGRPFAAYQCHRSDDV